MKMSQHSYLGKIMSTSFEMMKLGTERTGSEEMDTRGEAVER
jgi:hypothetical protein